ncbi:hypothetical protein G3578_14785 [Brevibacillus sp. SYP-B805]|uniref:type II secretion system F family protein n=1 Tax=Brevibacillus sp. SYP-B805 TaxID=1578199 RepID=UPI0013EC7FB3|nr:type II secretion system F family protein [Brevibacillus sp. SYP-B805]NGQ96427.1 hypothetical protein [Brevibacillus sp. SYP-B805]
MSYYLLFPMALCLFLTFFFWGTILIRMRLEPKVFYPKTVAILRKKLLADKNGRYVYGRYETWCSVVGSKLSPEGYFLLSFLGSFVGFWFGIFIGNIAASFSLFLLMLLAPSLLLYARYTVRVNKMIKSFCHFVDLFSRYYSGRGSIVLAFREMVEECPKELLPELLLLNNKLADGGDPVQAVESFAERLNHHWAHDFSTYIASGLEGETADIQSSLNRLTNEMFVQQDEKEERNSEIYSIWISLIIVIVICVLLIPYNQSLLKESYRLYFFTADGQSILSVAITVWCLSILLAFIWGRRHG